MDRAKRQMDLPTLRARYESAKANCISVELDVGLVFCRIAASSRDEIDAQRRYEQAVDAYAFAVRLLRNTVPPSDFNSAIKEKLNQLECALADLNQKAAEDFSARLNKVKRRNRLADRDPMHVDASSPHRSAFLSRT
jgi:hypothetical protein